METKKAGHPGFAAVLSFLLNGMGQIYNGQVAKGLVIILCSLGCMAVVFAGIGSMGYLVTGTLVFRGQMYVSLAMIVAGLIAVGWLGVYSMIDAYTAALKK